MSLYSDLMDSSASEVEVAMKGIDMVSLQKKVVYDSAFQKPQWNLKLC